MILFEDAVNIVLSNAITLDAERIDISESVGRILAEDLFSDMDMPPFDKSAVDGFACMTYDLKLLNETPQNHIQQTIILQVDETIAAGSIPGKMIQPGHCSKIMTGAMVPPGAGCVVMVEDTEPAGENLVRINQATESKNICYKGEDIKTGDLVLHQGIQIAPAHVAVLAAIGATNPLVSMLPRVGIISTGDELVEPSRTPGPAQIRNSNAWQLEAQLKTVPAITAYYGIASDESSQLRNMIGLAMEENDVVLLTGGVSMGEFDFVPAIMEEAGVEILFKSVAIQPGKPTVFGRRNNTIIFGLPGNPVSSFVVFEMLVRPFLRHMMGIAVDPPMFILPMGVDFSRRKSARKSMIPVMIRDGAVYPVDYHGSAHINAYAMASGILVMQIGTTVIHKGEPVHVRPI